MSLPARIGLIMLACRDVFSWRDPEGSIREVAWGKGTLDERGGVRLP